MTREQDDVIGSLVALCKRMEIKTLVQVGAEDGFESREIAAATGCRAICFEPDVRTGPISPGLEWHQQAVGATDGQVVFYVHKTSGLSGQLSREDGETKEMVPQTRLDTFCMTRKIQPDAIIIDTEGTTLDVLEGCGHILLRTKMLYCEVQTTVFRAGMRLLPEVDAFLAIRGFTAHHGMPSYGAGDAQGNMTWIRP